NSELALDIAVISRVHETIVSGAWCNHRMRPPNGSLSSAGRLADGPALFPVYGWDFSEWSLEETLGWLLDLRVAAGASPAAKATLYEGEPRWFPLIARAASPQALLSFRYTVWIFLSSHSRPCLGDFVQPVLRQ